MHMLAAGMPVAWVQWVDAPLIVTINFQPSRLQSKAMGVQLLLSEKSRKLLFSLLKLSVKLISSVCTWLTKTFFNSSRHNMQLYRSSTNPRSWSLSSRRSNTPSRFVEHSSILEFIFFSPECFIVWKCFHSTNLESNVLTAGLSHCFGHMHWRRGIGCPQGQLSCRTCFPSHAYGD